MNGLPQIKSRVKTLRYEAEGIISLELVPMEGEQFPPFTAGAHVDVHLANGITRSYSLLNSQNESGRYVIGVLKDRGSRGGSRYIHEQLRVGTELPISPPRNNFTLNEEAGHSVLVAGGIGITPMLSMYRRLRDLGRSVELLYFTRSRREAAFLDELAALQGDVTLRFDEEHSGTPPNLNAILASKPADADFYCCGPGRMLDTFEESCEMLGYQHWHVERFAAKKADTVAVDHGYDVSLAKSGKELHVPPGKTLLDALLDIGIKVEHSCREGICGACETRLLEGEADHRDSVLTKAEREKNKSMMVCVSGCKGQRLVLDL